eukprot:m.100308 g.100308  ORF g.100308 m.100308 type:complete len:53 (-) comp8925_c0_seq2:2085-2243(-)
MLPTKTERDEPRDMAKLCHVGAASAHFALSLALPAGPALPELLQAVHDGREL